MFRINDSNLIPRFSHCHFDDWKKSDEDLVCIDQFDAQEFNENEAGWLRNDLSALARATTQSQYDSIMRRLVEIKQQGGIPDGMTTSEAIALIKPRWAQSPNEIQQFVEMSNGDVMAKLNEAYEKAVKEVKVEKPAEVPAAAPADA